MKRTRTRARLDPAPSSALVAGADTHLGHQVGDDGELRGLKLLLGARLGVALRGDGARVLEAQLAQEPHVQLDPGLLELGDGGEDPLPADGRARLLVGGALEEKGRSSLKPRTPLGLARSGSIWRFLRQEERESLATNSGARAPTCRFLTASGRWKVVEGLRIGRASISARDIKTECRVRHYAVRT